MPRNSSSYEGGAPEKGRRLFRSSGPDDGPEDEERQKAEATKRAKLLSEDGLREAALRHLDRYDASRKQLETVLLRRVRKYATEDEVDAAKARIKELLERFSDARLIDDTRFSTSFVASARERGASTLKIRQKLLARGVSSELIEVGLLSAREKDGHDDRFAALTFARKRRLAEKFRLDEPKERGKALAVLGRQGFSFDAANDALRRLVEPAEESDC